MVIDEVVMLVLNVDMNLFDKDWMYVVYVLGCWYEDVG